MPVALIPALHNCGKAKVAGAQRVNGRLPLHLAWSSPVLVKGFKRPNLTDDGRKPELRLRNPGEISEEATRKFFVIFVTYHYLFYFASLFFYA